MLNPPATAFYEAFALYGEVVNEAFQAGKDFKDGFGLSKRLWNRTFDGVKKLHWVFFLSLKDIILRIYIYSLTVLGNNDCLFVRIFKRISLLRLWNDSFFLITLARLYKSVCIINVFRESSFAETI